MVRTIFISKAEKAPIPEKDGAFVNFELAGLRLLCVGFELCGFGLGCGFGGCKLCLEPLVSLVPCGTHNGGGDRVPSCKILRDLCVVNGHGLSPSYLGKGSQIFRGVGVVPVTVH